MSCSTTSISACLMNKTTLASEDPYVFTETAPTTPPILFNNSQKSRNRLVVKHLNLSSRTNTTTATLEKSPYKNKKLSISKVKNNNNNGSKTQTPTNVFIKGPSLNTSAVLGVLNTNNIKYGPNSSSSTKQQLQLLNQSKQAQRNENAATAGVGVVGSRSTQQQHQHQKSQIYQKIHQQQQQQEKQSQTPPPFILSHTPSLWQTPLLLESTKTKETTATAAATGAEVANFIKTYETSSDTFISSFNAATPIQIAFQPAPITNQPTIGATALITPISIAAVTTEATTCGGSIAPSVHLTMTSGTMPLPPSNFHNTTLAQHLQKVQCLKKSKKPPITTPSSNSHAQCTPIKKQQQLQQQHQQQQSGKIPSKTLSTTTILNTLGPAGPIPANALTLKNSTQHSTNDLHDIPVNVIFRSSTEQTNSIDCNSNKINDDCSTTMMLDNRMEWECPPQTTTMSIRIMNEDLGNNESSQIIINNNNNNNNKQSSTKLAQKRKNSITAPHSVVGTQMLTKIASSPKQRKIQNSKNAKLSISKRGDKEKMESKCIKSQPAEIMSDHHDLFSSIRKLNTNGMQTKTTQKRNCKMNFFSKSSPHDQSEFLMYPDDVDDDGDGGISSRTKAVAVIRMPYKECTEDISALAEESVLPYCIQRHWYGIDMNEPSSVLRSINASSAVGREERIIEYKNLLKRQAMQLLATRSLQQIPFHIARKRLICVNALLRKYRDHNKTASVETAKKRCEVERCSNAVVERATYCQQHITKNTKQSIFVQCSARNLKDDQKPCNVPVLNIKKPYSSPLCYIHTAHKQRNAASNNTPTKTTANALSLHTLYPQLMAAATQTKSPKSAGVYVAKTSSYRKRKAATPAAIISDRNSINNSNTHTHSLSNVNLMRFDAMPPVVSMQRKNSTTSLESIASNSQSSFASSMQQGLEAENSMIGISHAEQTIQTTTNMLSPAPPPLALLGYNNNNNATNCRVSNHHHHHQGSSFSHRESLAFGSGILDSTAEQEISKLVAQFAMVAEATSSAAPANNMANGNGGLNNNNSIQSFNYLNTNSNSNLTSSGVGSSSSLPSTDELLTQDMLSICENSSAYASSSEDTGLGELSENELTGGGKDGGGVSSDVGIGIGVVGGSAAIATATGVIGCGFNDDDVSPDEIPLGDTRLLEENDLVNVFGTLPVNLNELFTAVVRQDEREEVERALEIADKHLKTLQETIGSDSDFLADLLNVNDDMLAGTDDICSKMEIDSSVLSPPTSESIDTTSLYLQNTNNIQNGGTNNVEISDNFVNAGNSNNSGIADIREILQT